MGKKILDSKALYVVLSILIAVVMWFYVTSMDGNQRSDTIRNIPITFVGVEALESRGLMIAGDPPTASVTLKASPAIWAKLNAETVQLVVNLTSTSIEKAAEYTLAYTVVLPTGVNPNQVEITNGATGNVTFTVAEYREREIEIQGKFVGTAAEGYLAGDEEDFLFAPATITISGQAELVNQVSYAQVVVTGEDLTETVRGDYPFEFIGASGDVIKNLDVQCSQEVVSTVFPIWATAEVPLKLEFTEGGGVALDQVSYTLSVDSITVAGEKDAVSAITAEGAIVLGTVDLSTVHDGDQIIFGVPLTDELTNISGITEVIATLKLDSSLQSKKVEVTNISYINPPDGWVVNVITQALEVEIRGDPGYFEDVGASNVRVVADLKNINQAAGQYTVSATVYLDSVGTMDQVDVVDNDYKVVVSLHR